LARACCESAARKSAARESLLQERCAQEAAMGLWMPNGIPYRLISLSFEVKVSAQGAEAFTFFCSPKRK
jgi:hypothetical protein